MIILLTCVVVSTVVSKTVSSDFSLKGDPCSKFDSCLAKPHLRTCSCNDDCELYGTCCYDFKKRSDDSPKTAYTCYSRHTVTPVYVKRSCSDEFRGNVHIKLACLDDDMDEMDVQNNLLVTSQRTKITYWNKHCAECSYEIPEDLVLWNIEVYCPQRKNVDGSLIRRNLTFDQDKKQWGLEMDGEFLQCTVKYGPPPYIDEVKFCSPNLISSCPSDYTSAETVLACAKYYAERKSKGADVYYKNNHCAICNGADVRNLECSGMTTPEDSVEDSDFKEMVEVVFTKGAWLDKEPLKRFECSKGYSYDPGRTKCRRDEARDEIASPIPNSSKTCRTEGLAILVILFVFMYLY